MAWSINSVAQATPSTSSPLGITYAGVAGRLYVLCLSRNSAADPFTTVTDSAGNTWTRLDYAPKSGTVGRRVEMWSCVPASNFATISAAFTGSTIGYATLVEITGGNGVANKVVALERSNSANPPAVSITPDEDNTLILAFCQANPNTISEMNPGAGWTSLASNTGGPDVVYRTDIASGVSVGVSWTFDTGAGSGHAIAAFEEASPSVDVRAVVELGATATTSGDHSRSPSAGLSLGATAVVAKEITVSPTVGIELSATAVVEPVQIEDLEVTILAGRDDDWRPDTDQTLIAKYLTTGDQRAWMLGLDADGGGDLALVGRPMFVWSTDGTAAEVVEVYATERAPVDPYGQVHLRVFLDVNNGAGGWTVVFEYRDPDGVWVTLGEPVTGSGATLINPSSTADLTIGAHDDGTAGMFVGRAYSAQVRVGRAGEVQALVDFTNHPAGTTSFSDDTGNAWTVEAPATLTSAQTLTTIAVLGPLETDECATWTDFTLPRSGVGRTCDHQPEECCSYYRVRTVGRVDGSLLVSDWSDTSDPDVFCLEWDEDEHLIRTTGPTGPLWAPVLGKFDWAVERPFTAATGVMGSRFVTSAAPGGRNFSMTAAVESEEELARLRAVLARPLVLISPSDAEEVWAAPVAESVRIVKVGRIRQVTASFVGTGPEPPPQLADVGA